MDTGQHWRAHTTNLLSVEMLTLARRMLKPGGVIYYNTTYSDDAQKTGANLFPYAWRFGPFLAVSDAPLRLDEARWRATITQYRLEGKRVLDLEDARGRARLEQIAGYLRAVDPTGESIWRRRRGRIFYGERGGCRRSRRTIWRRSGSDETHGWKS